MAWSTSASPPMVATPGGVISIVMFPFSRGLLQLRSGRPPLAPITGRIALCCWRSGRRPDGYRFDPSYDVRFLQQALRLQQMGDFDHRAMDDRIGDGGAEKGGLELPRFRKIVRPFPARLGESKVGARRHDPRRLEHRGDL